jgi:putative ABC transport system permease protein
LTQITFLATKFPWQQARIFRMHPSANGREYIINEALAKELLKDTPNEDLNFLLGKQFGFDTLGQIVTLF